MTKGRLLTTLMAMPAVCALGALLSEPAAAATITWKTGVSGSWTVASNWLPSQVPGSGDVAVITVSPAVEGGYDVNINSNVSVNAINLGSSARLRVNNVALTTTTGIAVGSSSNLELNSGTLSGGGVSLNGKLSSTGTSNVNVALTTATSSTIEVGAGSLTVANGFTNNGTLSYPSTGARDFYVTNGTFTNSATGTISSATISSSLHATLNNQGSITLSGSQTRLDVVKSGVTHSHSGSISVTGTGCTLAFDLSGSTLNTSGNISVGAGCYISLADGAFHHTAGIISGAGILQIVATTAATFASNPTIAKMHLAGRGMNFPSSLSNGAVQAITFGPQADLTAPQFTNQFGYTLDFYGISGTTIHAPIFTNLGVFAVSDTLVLDGNLNLGPASLLVMNIGAGTALLDVSGAFQAGGTMRVLDFWNDPVAGDTHDLITDADRIGDFAQLELAQLGLDRDLYVMTDAVTTSSNTQPYRVRIVRQKWALLTPSGTAPVPRRGQSAVYAPSSGSMVVFGGENGAGQMLNDVWVLNHADGLSGSPAWVKLNPAGVPPAPRKGHSAVYDVGSNRMTVFGGESDSSVFLADIWILTNADGTTGTPAWEQFAPIPGVFPRSGHGAGYSPVSNRMVMSQGGGSDCGPYYGEMWTLDHANGLGTSTGWTLWSIFGTPPSDRRDASCAYDPVRNRLLVYGGRALCGAVQTDAFLLSNADGSREAYTAWNPLAAGASPALPGQAGAQAAYDPYYDRLITFGGLQADGTTLSSQVFYLGNTLGGAAGWTRLPLPSTRPSARAFHSMVYSVSAKRWIVFGGDANGTLMNDVWTLELDGDGALVTGIGSEPDSPQKKHLAFSASPYPNPSSRGMQFSVKALEDTRAQIVIYDALGRRVVDLYNGPMTMGEHRFGWAEDVASGIYFVEVRSGEIHEVRRIVVAH